jgi:hypothetical protein
VFAPFPVDDNSLIPVVCLSVVGLVVRGFLVVAFFATGFLEATLVAVVFLFAMIFSLTILFVFVYANTIGSAANELTALRNFGIRYRCVPRLYIA